MRLPPTSQLTTLPHYWVSYSIRARSLIQRTLLGMEPLEGHPCLLVSDDWLNWPHHQTTRQALSAPLLSPPNLEPNHVRPVYPLANSQLATLLHHSVRHSHRDRALT